MDAARSQIDAANAQIASANGQIEAANQQISGMQASMAGAQVAIQGIQGSADENGMVSAASLNAVIGMLGNSASGVSGVDAVQNNVENMDASAYTAQAQQIADAACTDSWQAYRKHLNGTAGQLNEAAEGLKKGAETLGTKSGEMKAGADQMEAGAQKMAAGAENIPSIPADPINQVTNCCGTALCRISESRSGCGSGCLCSRYTGRGNKRFPEGSCRCKGSE